MNKYLQISNKGEIQNEAFTLVGASTKRGDDSKIGMFGSGANNSMAYLIRNDYDVNIYRNGNPIDIGLIPVQFRDQEFKVITIDGEKTSITTEMGPQWTLWMAIRELYANAVDEGMTSFKFVEDVNPTPGCTDVFIKANQDLEEFMINIKDYIGTTKNVIFEDSTGKILAKHKNDACIYRKGMKCYDTTYKSAYDYDFFNIKINESRIVMYSWDISKALTKMLFNCNEPSVVRHILESTIDNKYIESRVDSNSYYFPKSFDHDVWLKAIEGKQIAPLSLAMFIPIEDHNDVFFLGSNMYQHLKDYLPGVRLALNTSMIGDVAYIEKLPNALQADTLREVMKFLNECNFSVNYPIKVVQFEKKGVHGLAKDGTIFLSLKALDEGKTHTANVIIEEYIHLKHGVADETRQFQKAAIMELINYMKTAHTYNL